MITISLRLDRVLLAVYLLVLLILLVLPIPGSKYELLGIGADKWMHVILFGGLAVVMRWNFRAMGFADFVAVGAVFAVALATELVQGLINYRSAETWDLVAGLLGAALGVACTHRILLAREPEKLIGALVATLGVAVIAIFSLADLIGVGKDQHFGSLQMAGAALGAIIVSAGLGVIIMRHRLRRI